MRAQRRDGGQTSIEFVAILLLLGLIIAMVASAGLARTVNLSMRSTVCEVVQDQDCDHQGNEGRQSDQSGEGFLDRVLTSAGSVLSVTGDVLRGGLNRVWHVGRLGINGPVSFAAWLYAEARGGDCYASPGLIFTCVNTRPQSMWQAPLFQVGNITISGEASVDSAVQGHETRHADQWAIFGGGLVFPLLYGLEQLRVRGRRSRNLFERWAGLEEGGYELPATPP